MLSGSCPPGALHGGRSRCIITSWPPVHRQAPQGVASACAEGQLWHGTALTLGADLWERAVVRSVCEKPCWGLARLDWELLLKSGPSPWSLLSFCVDTPVPSYASPRRVLTPLIWLLGWILDLPHRCRFAWRAWLLADRGCCPWACSALLAWLLCLHVVTWAKY